MPGIEVKVVKELDDQIVALKEAIEKAGEKGRENLKSINVEAARQQFIDASGKFDEQKWADLKDKQQEVYDRLSMVHKCLQSAAGLDGPKDPHHIMFDDYASTAAIIWLTIVSFALMFLLLGTVIWQWNCATEVDLTRKMQAAKPLFAELNKAKQDADAARKEFAAAQEKVEVSKAEPTGDKRPPEVGQNKKILEEAQKNLDVMTTKQAKAQTEVDKAIEGMPVKGATEGTILIMVILLGALGGSLHLVSSLVKFVGNRQFKRSWILYYLAMPLTGAGLAPVVYLLLRVGLISPSGVSANGSSIANLNLMAIYAFALLTGMFSRAATDKLAEVFSTVFKTTSAPSKDALGPKKPPEGTATGAAKSP
jgi:hypothetical protein